MSEPFSLRKLLSSPFTGLYWSKSLMFGIGIFCMLFVGYAVYKAYFKKQDSTQSVIAGKGATVNLIQNNQKKRYFIPFVEGFSELNNNTDGFNFGGRAGLRFEF